MNEHVSNSGAATVLKKGRAHGVYTRASHAIWMLATWFNESPIDSDVLL